MGTLATANDQFFTETAEIEEACAAHAKNQDACEVAVPDLVGQVAQRRELREARKRLFALGMIPRGSKLKTGPIDISKFTNPNQNDDDNQMLEGFTVSLGKNTGQAIVNGAPAEFEKMTPDTILFCTTTTPAWTPFFAQTAGSFTDIGSILADGSIVTRQDGIPTGMGMGNAFRRFVSGQRIAVDGDAGAFTIVSPEQDSGDQAIKSCMT